MQDKRRWHEEMRGRPIFWAVLLGIAVALALVLAIIDSGWRNGLKDFQIALAGLGALAAALAQHDGATAAVREARRKEDRDREELRRRLLIQCRLDAFGLHQVCIALANAWQGAPPQDNDHVFKGLTVVPHSAAIAMAWEQVVLFSEEVAVTLSDMVRHTSTIANIRVACTAYAEAPPEQKIIKKKDTDDLVFTLKSTAGAAEKLALAMGKEAEDKKKAASQ